MTPEQAKAICIQAHKGQWRRPVELFGNNHPLPNSAITLLQINNQNDFTYEHNGLLYSMDIDLRLFVQKPYSSHPIAVADMMTTDEEKVVAYLHDVIEDTGWTLGATVIGNYYRLVSPEGEIHDISKTTYEALLLLTKEDSIYIGYIRDVVLSKLATKVKIADITHNLSSNPTDSQKRKYQQAMKILLATL